MTLTNFFWIAFHEKIYNNLPSSTKTSLHHLRQEVSGSNSLLIPQSSTPLRSSVRQPFFFLFFCRSVRSRSHARSDKASNLSGPKIYSNLPYPKCFNIDVVCYQVKQQSKKQRKIQKNLQINDRNASNLQIFKSQKFGTSPNHPLSFLGIWTHYLDIFPHTECSKLDPKLPHIALPGWFLLEGTCLRKETVKLWCLQVLHTKSWNSWLISGK